MNLYDLQLKYTEAINENLICPICCHPFLDPVISSCKHYFCKRCIEKALEIKEECPIDRLKMCTLDLLEAPSIILNMVNELKVCCPRKDNGCTVQTQRQYLISHLSDCMFINNEVEENQGMCKETLAEESCPHCQSEIAKSKLISHVLVCDLLVVACRCHQFGCDWKGFRKDIKSHSVECCYVKLEPFLESHALRVSALERENAELRNLIKSFKDGLEIVTEQVKDLSLLMQRSQLLRPGQDRLLGPNDNTIGARHSSDELPAASFERIRADHQRLRFELLSLSSSVGSLELKQELALTTECSALREEIHDMQFSIQALKLELDDLSRERQNTLSALASLAKSASNRASRNSKVSSQAKPLKPNECKL